MIIAAIFQNQMPDKVIALFAQNPFGEQFFRLRGWNQFCRFLTAINLMRTTDNFIHPEEQGNLQYWSKKWGVSSYQLHEAIMNTGTLSADKLRQYLKRDSWLEHPVEGTKKILQKTIQYIF
jgi:hypothetical protein